MAATNRAARHEAPPPAVARGPRAALAVPDRPLRAAALALAVIAACATGGARRDASPALDLRDGAVVEGDTSGALAGKSEDELLALAAAATAAGDPARAAAAYGRAADAYPGSARAGPSRVAAGRAWGDAGRWDLARERFHEAAAGGEAAAAEARFLEAESLYHLGRAGEARAMLDELAGRQDLPPGQRVRALAQAGAIAFEERDAPGAERTLRLALVAAHADASPGAAAVEPYWAAKAAFFLGELARAEFEATPVEPASGDADALAWRLEAKSRLLLVAQERYLAVPATGDPRWAVAAGTRVGELYETLHRQLLEAPPPPGLGGAEGVEYRRALRAQLRVLLAKAVDAYGETLASARRAGVEDEFTRRADEGLRRARALLDEADRDAPPPEPPVGRAREGGARGRAGRPG